MFQSLNVQEGTEIYFPYEHVFADHPNADGRFHVWGKGKYCCHYLIVALLTYESPTVLL